MKKYEREVKWMRYNHLPFEEIPEPCLGSDQPPQVFDAQALKDEQKLPIENLLDRAFQHNRTKADKLRIPAYNELVYFDIIDRFIEDYKIIDKTTPITGLKLEQLRKVILSEKKRHLYLWCERRAFDKCVVKMDGNCGPRSIAARILGNQERWPEVRQKVCTEIRDQARASLMSQPGVWYTDIEFQAAAYAFDVPIIVFSPLHKMAFFDCLFEAKTPQGMAKPPAYILHNGTDHYTPLI